MQWVFSTPNSFVLEKASKYPPAELQMFFRRQGGSNEGVLRITLSGDGPGKHVRNGGTTRLLVF